MEWDVLKNVRYQAYMSPKKDMEHPSEMSSISENDNGFPSLFVGLDLLANHTSSATETHRRRQREKQQKLQHANEKQRLFQHSTQGQEWVSEKGASTWIYYALPRIYGHVNI